ncbi:MAG: ABC transporter substrate-binding protein [Desulfuromonadales bacterium]
MRHFLLVITVTSCCLLLPSCKDPEPIRIGFIGGLTARAAGLSTSGRDGFLLAIEEVNARGGINNRKVEALVQDTHMHKESALQAVHNLIAHGVSAIIGPMTSQDAVTIVPEINRARVPMVSPTVSTNELTGLDDYFFRVYYSNAQAAQLLAEKVSTQTESIRITAIYDLDNRAYTEDWILHFQEILEQRGGSLVGRIPFDFHDDSLFIDIANRAAATNPQGILILANAVDTAMICQQLLKIGVDLPLYATGWSYSDDLLQFGGKSVEGLTIIQSADLQDPAPAMQHFVNTYQERFHSMPNFPAMHAYDATRRILAIFEKTTEPEKIREELLQADSFAGLQTDLAVDRFGDLKNPRLFLARIANGQFVKAE